MNDTIRGAHPFLVICCLLILSTHAVPAQAQTDTVWVTMTDGVRLLTDLYEPPGSGPWPVVLIRTPYVRDWYYNSQFFVDNGFFVVVQSCRGRHGSEGDFLLYRIDNERSDGHDTIEWIAQQPWCDGNIGMVGLSGLAATQYAVMKDAPPALKCLAPERQTPFWYQHHVFQGGAYRDELNESVCRYFDYPPACDQLLLHRLYDAFWEPLDGMLNSDTIHVPMLHIGGWYDVMLQGSLDALSYFQHFGGTGAAGNQYLIIDPLTHHYGFGQLDDPPEQFPRGDGDFYHQHLLAWLDHWLKQTGSIDEWPTVYLYLMGACEEPGAPGCHWVGLDSWPPSDHWPKSFYLAADGTLSETVPDPAELELTINPLDPVPTLGGANLAIYPGNLSGPYDQSPLIESREDVLVFSTDVLTEPLEVMGRVTARIWIRPDTLDLDLSVRLTDVYPDGRSMLVTDGIQRARMRCDDEYECFLTIGEPTEIEVDLWSTAMVFNAGHKIRVAIAGTNYPRFERNDNSGGDLNDPQYQVAQPVILFGPGFPTSIELPVPVVFGDGFEFGNTSSWSGAVP
jgi:predicted acyl esterase